MAKAKKQEEKIKYVEREPMIQPITETIETNYMPYAVSVMVSRAIPEIDGFKPAHRKLLYTMYKMGLLNGRRTKSANIVGETMKLNPHGDMAIYETMVRLTTGNESLLHPFVDSRVASVSSIAAIWRLPHQDIPRQSLTRSVKKFSQALIKTRLIWLTTTTAQ